ncbi:NAD-dependent epimerase/dehydratase family protein [Umezawaea beigongshangensis]|uniref:NAD-dependent epimerase/dehydratase family protein n=1 Tax=Umezawaea beigongshangensis TaxID=2780383 RepID=UPI001E3BA8AD|nr:NAD-dependent epimerase/dehydratase family protein [Umezawaea beigongshangensis]
MKVFLTGATGYIGSVIAEKLLQAGHDVVGLARSDTSADKLKGQGVEPVRGEIGDTERLTDVARGVDGVVHTVFDSSSLDWTAANAGDVAAVNAVIAGLRGTGKPFIYTSGTGVLGNTGEIVYDEDTPVVPSELPAVKALQQRLDTEKAVLGAAGVSGIVLRPPNVYGRGDGRAVFWMIREAAKKLGAVPYAIGSEGNRWAYVHVDDLADLFVLALDQTPAGELFHTGAQSGLRTRDIATALSRGTGLGGKTIALEMSELEAAIGFPFVGEYWASNSQSSSDKARRVLGWKPQHLDLLDEISRPSR